MTEEMKYFKKVYDWEQDPNRVHQNLAFIVGYGKANAVKVANYLRKEGYTVSLRSGEDGFFTMIEVKLIL